MNSEFLEIFAYLLDVIEDEHKGLSEIVCKDIYDKYTINLKEMTKWLRQNH